MLFGRNQKNPIKLTDKGIVDWKYTTCGYCSTGCSIEVGLNKEGKAVSARGVGDASVNQGKLCIKGILEYELFETDGRGRVPLVRGVIGTNNYDGNTTLCMASAVSGYKRSFGSDGPPGCYENFQHTDCLLAIAAWFRLSMALSRMTMPALFQVCCYNPRH